jgi:putative membrane protein
MIIHWLNSNKLKLSIFLIWLFHFSAIIGIILGFEDWFLPLTPLNLILCFGLLVWNISQVQLRDVLLLFIPFAFGMVAEWLGVNFGLIFGDYEYGQNLGAKIWGVPWMIGVNWSILVLITADIAKNISAKIWLSALIAALFMVGLDVLLEIVAPPFDFWEFKRGVAPLQNYVGWLVVAFLAQFIFQYYYTKSNFILSFATFIVFTLFFGVAAFLFY